MATERCAGVITVSDAVDEDPEAAALIRRLAALQRDRWLRGIRESESLDTMLVMVPCD
jgi:hypothetical protein